MPRQTASTLALGALLLRHLGALLAGLVQADGDGLLPALGLPPLAAFLRARLLLLDCPLDAALCLLAVLFLGHDTSPTRLLSRIRSTSNRRAALRQRPAGL